MSLLKCLATCPSLCFPSMFNALNNILSHFCCHTAMVLVEAAVQLCYLCVSSQHHAESSCVCLQPRQNPCCASLRTEARRSVRVKINMCRMDEPGPETGRPDLWVLLFCFRHHVVCLYRFLRSYITCCSLLVNTRTAGVWGCGCVYTSYTSTVIYYVNHSSDTEMCVCVCVNCLVTCHFPSWHSLCSKT